MMFVSPRGISPPPPVPSDAPAHALWRVLGMASSAPWLCAWIAKGSGVDRHVEQIFASTSAELVGRIRASPQNQVLQIQCYSPRNLEGGWACRRIAAVWVATRDRWPITIFTDVAGQDFLIMDQEEAELPSDMELHGRHLVARVGAVPARGLGAADTANNCIPSAAQRKIERLRVQQTAGSTG